MRKSQKIITEDLESSSLLDTPEKTTPEVPNGSLKSTCAEIFDEPPMKVMPTLPESFRSLVDIPIDITNENRKPQNIITLLGDALGISDYQSNMASFWFLDFIALQVLKYETTLNSHDRSVMVSWLAGEMKLIQEGNLSREAFFQRMAEIFLNVSEKLSHGNALQHWNLMSFKNLEKGISSQEDMEQELRQWKEETTKKNSEHRISSKSDKKIPANEGLSTSENNSHKLLDVIMETTYCMYGDSFHYALIVAAFVKPVLLHEYILPFTLRTPRPLKVIDIEKDKKKKAENGNGFNKKTNTKKNRKSNGIGITAVAEKPPTPITLTEEETLAKEREFILPLMESNEAASILEAYKHENSQKKSIAGAKKKNGK